MELKPNHRPAPSSGQHPIAQGAPSTASERLDTRRHGVTPQQESHRAIRTRTLGEIHDSQPRPRSTTAGTEDERTLAAWRQLAEDREKQLAIQEDINRRLENLNKQFELQIDSLRREIALDQVAARSEIATHDDDTQQIGQAGVPAAEFRTELIAIQGTLAWKLAERLRQVFPAQTRRGRVLRSLLRRMLNAAPR